MDGYKSSFGTCDFVDTGKKEGYSYDKYLIRNGLPRLASKADVKNDLYDIVKVHGSYLKPEEMNVVKPLLIILLTCLITYQFSWREWMTGVQER